MTSKPHLPSQALSAPLPISGNASTDVPTGDQWSIDELIDAFHARVYGFCLRLTANAQDAEDIAQQTFLVACQRLHQLRDTKKAASWLLVIAKSCFLKQIRRKRPASESSLEISVSDFARQGQPKLKIDQQVLQAALAKLGDDHRLILTMFYFQGLSYRQIAAELDVQMGTVMSRIARAKAKLRGFLVQDEVMDYE